MDHISFQGYLWCINLIVERRNEALYEWGHGGSVVQLKFVAAVSEPDYLLLSGFTL